MYAGILMCAGLCFHFYGNELARAASVSLISAKETGLDAAALTYTVAFGCPASALTLYAYTLCIRNYGAHTTFRLSGLICLAIFLSMTTAVFSGLIRENMGFKSKLSIVAFYAFREIYATLLSTQQWAFIVSALDHTTSSYIVTFSGAVSVASTLGGICVERIVTRYGESGILTAAALAVVMTIVASEAAFYVYNQTASEGKCSLLGPKCSPTVEHHKAHQYIASANTSTHTQSNTPSKQSKSHSSNLASTKMVDTKAQSLSNYSENKSSVLHKHVSTKSHHKSDHTAAAAPSSVSMIAMLKDSLRLLSNITLQLLVAEAVVHQCCTNMLNILFYDGLRMSIQAPDERAVIVGRFFALVNLTACLLQIFVVPRILSQRTLPFIMLVVPIVVSGVCSVSWIIPSLTAVMVSFGALKVLEYSVLSGAMEMIYMPLDPETRYLGKEYVRFFGTKLGKTGASLLLTGLTAQLKPALGTQCFWSLALAAVWTLVMAFLSSHLQERCAVTITEVKDAAVETATSEVEEVTTYTSCAAPVVVEVPVSQTTAVFKTDVALLANPKETINDEIRNRKRSRTLSLCDADTSNSLFAAADMLYVVDDDGDSTSGESDFSGSARAGGGEAVSSRSLSPLGLPTHHRSSTGLRKRRVKSIPRMFPLSLTDLASSGEGKFYDIKKSGAESYDPCSSRSVISGDYSARSIRSSHDTTYSDATDTNQNMPPDTMSGSNYPHDSLDFSSPIARRFKSRTFVGEDSSACDADDPSGLDNTSPGYLSTASSASERSHVEQQPNVGFETFQTFYLASAAAKCSSSRLHFTIDPDRAFGSASPRSIRYRRKRRVFEANPQPNTILDTAISTPCATQT